MPSSTATHMSSDSGRQVASDISKIGRKSAEANNINERLDLAHIDMFVTFLEEEILKIKRGQ